MTTVDVVTWAGGITAAARGRLHSPLRYPAAAASLAMAAFHVPVTRSHLTEAPYIGWSFIAVEVVGLMFAAWLLWRDDPRVYAAAAVVSVGAVAAYLVSRSIGLPQMADDIGNWADPWGVACIASEFVLAVLCAAAMASSARAARRRPG